jgi:hypothetical protein
MCPEFIIHNTSFSFSELFHLSIPHDGFNPATISLFVPANSFGRLFIRYAPARILCACIGDNAALLPLLPLRTDATSDPPPSAFPRNRAGGAKSRLPKDPDFLSACLVFKVSKSKGFKR